MMIETNCTVTGFSGLSGNNPGLDTGNDGTAESFAAYLNEEMAVSESAVAGIAVDTEVEEVAEYNQDIATIKEKGIVAFIIEQHEKRIREEILASMGLTEEALAEMPPEQQQRIEKIIADEIEKRKAAEELMENKKNKKSNMAQLLGEVGMGTVPGAFLQYKLESDGFF